LKPKGGLGQNSTVNANSDLFFRAPDGIRSEILGQRQFSTWGNVAQSREVSPTVDADAQGLLQHSSAINFDNRLLMTAHPQQAALGVYHDTLIALNFDPVSNLRGKAESVYDGTWNGLNVLQVLVGQFNNQERAFAFCLSSDLTKIELWELLPTASTTVADNDTTPIAALIESGSMKFGQDDPRKRDLKGLKDGEIYVDRLTGTVSFAAYYKPDQWPTWVPWHSWTVTADPNSEPGFRPRMGLGEPRADDVDNVNNRPLREGFTFQFKLVITGDCRFLGAKFAAVTLPQTQFALPM